MAALAMTRKDKARVFGQDIMRGEHELGTPSSEDADNISGTSIFDPVICEIAYRWFCPPNGKILDPFAGGSVRGILASRIGHAYTGIELRPEQIAANRAQGGLCTGPLPNWIEGDSRFLERLLPDEDRFDLIFSCPPYWNLEIYSDDPRDLSTMGREEFFTAQADIISDCVARLKPDRFAVWVCSDVRDKFGFYINLPGKTIDAFAKAGAGLYNDAVLVTMVGSLAVRINAQFTGSRKLGKTHQNVLVFCKGDPKKATAAIGDVEFGEVPSEEEAAA